MRRDAAHSHAVLLHGVLTFANKMDIKSPELSPVQFGRKYIFYMFTPNNTVCPAAEFIRVKSKCW